MAPPAESGVRRMEGVQLPNGEYVGVRYVKMPDLFDGVTARDAMKVQRIVGQALEDGPIQTKCAG